MHVRPLQADHVREEPLREAVLAHDADGLGLARAGQLEVPVAADDDQPVTLHARDRLGDRRAGVPEALGDPGAQRGDAFLGELVDRLEVHLRRVDQVAHCCSLQRRVTVLQHRLVGPADMLGRATAYPRHVPDDHAAPDDPAHLLPSDGRFGSGPSKVRAAQLEALAGPSAALLGTSHRQAPVRALVGRVRAGLSALLDLPDGYEIVLGNGGSSAFWDVATLCLVDDVAAFGTFGEFGAKFAAAATRAPFLGSPVVSAVAPGEVSVPTFVDGADAYAWPHNETSTGVVAPVRRVAGSREQGALVLVDGTSGAGGLTVDVEPDRRLLLRAAEVVRLGRRALARRRLARRDRAGRAHRVRRPLGARVPVVHGGGHQLAPGPDAQHPGDRDARAPGRAARLDPRQRRAVLGGGADRDLGRPPVRLGRRARLGHPVRGRARDPLERRRDDRPVARDRGGDRGARCCARTASSTSSRTASSAATSCGSRCTRRSTPDDVLALTACIDHVVDQLL